jgi:hypothetical protein
MEEAALLALAVTRALTDDAGEEWGAEDFAALPKAESRPSRIASGAEPAGIPLGFDLTPALTRGALDWSALGTGVDRLVDLAPALSGAWTLAGSPPTSFLRQAAPTLRLSLCGLRALFTALGIAPDEPRARHWIEDVLQFIGRRIAASARSRVDWEFRADRGVLVLPAQEVRAPVIQAQIALQSPCGHAVRVGFRVTRATGAEHVVEAVARAVLFGARELWITRLAPFRLLGQDARNGWRERLSVADGPRGFQRDGRGDARGFLFPNGVPVANGAAMRERLARLGLDDSSLPPHRGACLTASPRGLVVAFCDQCGSAMSQRPAALWCPTCGFVLAAS